MTTTVDSCKKECIKLIQQLGMRHNTWQVFNDLLEMSAISISNSVDWVSKQDREKTYFDISKRYNQSELEVFPQILAELVIALDICAKEKRLQDILGQIFHELELHNKYKGQFFTPQEVCDFMGDITLNENVKAQIADKGYITVGEPACGSGATILGLVNAMIKQNHNYCNEMIATLTDIDLKCVHMAYLQLSLYGIPAVIIHGNTLLMAEWSRWYTPIYILNGWVWRETCGNADKRYREDELMKRSSEPMYAAIRDMEALIDDSPSPIKIEEVKVPEVEYKEADSGQMMMF